MIAFPKSVDPKDASDAWHEGFLAMLPAIRRHACLAFRGLTEESQDDAIAETVANALVAYQRLYAQGRSSLAYPSALARYAVAQVRAGRRVGNRQNSKDVMSPVAQRRHGFTVNRFDDFDPHAGRWIEAVIEESQTPVPDQAAFRCDFPAWLAMHSPRDRRIAEALMQGHLAHEVAEQFGLAPSRVSQLRGQLHNSWRAFHGDREVTGGRDRDSSSRPLCSGGRRAHV